MNASATFPLTVGLLGPTDYARWDAFVHAMPDATFFHRAGWQRILEQAFHYPTWYFYVESGGQLRGILPLAQVRSRLFGNALCSLPFCVYGGIVALDRAAADALDRAAQSLARRLRVDHLEYRHRQPQREDRLRKDLYYTFRKDLLPDAEANLLAIPRKQRAMVRKGIAAGLHSVIDADPQRFYQAYAASVHRLGTPVFSRRYVELLQQEFGRDCEILCVQQQQHTVCAVLSFYFRGEVLPYYGGGGTLARALAGNDFMYWEVLRRACERGCTGFDFGRSKLGTGAYDFKKNWGFQPAALAYEYQLHAARSLPDHQPLNPRYRLLIKLWQQLPAGVVNALGPGLIRQLG
ncbi:MAG: FemAB family XrtA/PEP-CTERM system-associated protein [Sphingomonadaceae bacterium]